MLRPLPQHGVLPGPLAPGHVYLWHIEPAAGDAALPAAIALLQPSELERMRRMRSGLAREEMVLSRACLRVLLGSALGCPPDQVKIQAGPDGKPHCTGNHPCTDPEKTLHFNVAHSHGRIVIAMCLKARVGVDVERMDANVDIFEVAQANFAPNEVRAIKMSPSFEQATRAFYRIWTGKEALLKAHGTGLLAPLNGFDLGAMEASREQSYLVGANGNHGRYYLRGLTLEHESEAGVAFAAALAMSEPDFSLKAHTLYGTQIQQLLEGAL